MRALAARTLVDAARRRRKAQTRRPRRARETCSRAREAVPCAQGGGAGCCARNEWGSLARLGRPPGGPPSRPGPTSGRVRSDALSQALLILRVPATRRRETDAVGGIRGTTWRGGIERRPGSEHSIQKLGCPPPVEPKLKRAARLDVARPRAAAARAPTRPVARRALRHEAQAPLVRAPPSHLSSPTPRTTPRDAPPPPPPHDDAAEDALRDDRARARAPAPLAGRTRGCRRGARTM